jgi:hypothetical protein
MANAICVNLRNRRTNSQLWRAAVGSAGGWILKTTDYTDFTDGIDDLPPLAAIPKSVPSVKSVVQFGDV